MLTDRVQIRSVIGSVYVDLSKLNPPQREAAGHGGGPILVLAGAGSGKTRVITFRIAHLLGQGVPPHAICAVTFTNKAAEEMRERIAHLLKDRELAKELTIGTFHALGLQILRTERKALGLPRGFAIYDQSDQLGAVREAMRHVHDGDRRYDAKAVLTRISLAKNAFVAPEELEGNPADDYDAMTAEVYPKYQETLRACAAFDFDDLIVEPVRLWQRDAEVRRKWNSRFQFVMVDEFQDTNKAQLRMVQHLVELHGNLCVVGDDDQSIYSWRGADPSNILQFDKTFPGAKVVKLEQNYRSTKTILAAANEVIGNNKDRHGKTLWSDLGGGAIITHAVAPTAEDEAKWIAREIRQLQKEGRRWSDFAILYRSNIQAKVLEEELRTAEVPYVMYGGQQFFERKEVKDVIAYMRVALNPRDELGLRRIINYPARGIGATTIEKLVQHSQTRHMSLWEALSDAETAGVHGAARTAIEELQHIVRTLGASFDAGENVVTATKQMIDEIGLYDDLRSAAPSMSAAQRRIDNVTGLINSLERFVAKGKGIKDLAEYLRMLSLDSKDDDPKHDDTGDKAVLTTLHGAKGLEFPVCFMIGLEEELLPHIRTLQPQATDPSDQDHATDISEERRLCYVGITRAQRKLYLTRACTRVSRGRVLQRTPSRFLLEIPDELLEVRDLGEEARQVVPKDEVKNFFATFQLDD
ncbi:MAG TPA: UvrD-helicase domain-containing protein [Kofleriaceae bacterium]|nr:UvrD-helicase domain-containing protein [Kofleriaceae bacterium]